MGLVYRAVHPKLKRLAAVKVLRAQYAQAAEHAERFLREGQALAGLHHKGIVGVENFGTLPDGRQYMVMEVLEGESLEALLAREGPLAPKRALPLMDEVLDALGAAHGAGVVHRDLKPSNVFLVQPRGGSSYVKLVDFGLAKVGVVAAGAKASVVAGTPQYISPEQAQGLAATARSDLYCLGGMLFELLTGRVPFEGRSWAELVSAQLRQEAPRLSSLLEGVPPALDALVAELLQKDPGKRPPSCEAVRSRLRAAHRAMENQPTLVLKARAVPLPAPTKPMLATPAAWPASEVGGLTNLVGVKRKWFAVWLAVLVVLGGAGAAAVAWRLNRPPPLPQKPEVVAAQVPRPTVEPSVAVDPELEAKLKAAAQRERELSRRDPEDPGQSLKKMATGGAVRLDAPDKVEGYQRALAEEVLEGMNRKRLAEGSMTDEERARAEVLALKQRADQEAKFKGRCTPGWQKRARAEISRAKKEKLAALDPDGPRMAEQLEQINADAADLGFMISSATDGSCPQVLTLFDRWASPSLDQQLKRAQEREAELGRDQAKREFALRMEKTKDEGGYLPAGHEDRKANQFNSVLAGELQDNLDIRRKRAENLTEEQRARAAVLELKKEQEAQKKCGPTWKKDAKARVKKVTDQRLAAQKQLADSAELQQELRDDAKQLTLQIEAARSLEECLSALGNVESFSR